MDKSRWQGVALGASQPDPEFGNVALPGVVRNQQAGRRRAGEGVVAGQRYLDAGFTPEILRRLMGAPAGPGPSFLHIATHFKTEKSLLLLKVLSFVWPPQTRWLTTGVEGDSRRSGGGVGRPRR